MGEGKAAEVDREVMHILSQRMDITGPVHFGIYITDSWEDFLSRSTTKKSGQLEERDLLFSELTITGVVDDRSQAPTRRTRRTHSYLLETYISYVKPQSYHEMRKIVQTFLDLLHNHPRAFPSDGVSISVSTGSSVVSLDRAMNAYVVWYSRITFDVIEDVAYGT
jgi:hypothetical protein